MSVLTAIYFSVTSLSTAGTANIPSGHFALFSRACPWRRRRPPAGAGVDRVGRNAYSCHSCRRKSDFLLGLVLKLACVRACVLAFLRFAGLEGLKPLEWPGGEFLLRKKQIPNALHGADVYQHTRKCIRVNLYKNTCDMVRYVRILRHSPKRRYVDLYCAAKESTICVRGVRACMRACVCLCTFTRTDARTQITLLTRRV